MQWNCLVFAQACHCPLLPQEMQQIQDSAPWWPSPNSTFALLHFNPVASRLNERYGNSHQDFHDEKPFVAHFRVFRCLAYVHVPKENCSDLDAKSRQMTFLGYNVVSKAYCLYDPQSRKVVVSRDVVFDDRHTTSQGGCWNSFLLLPSLGHYRGFPELMGDNFMRVPCMWSILWWLPLYMVLQSPLLWMRLFHKSILPLYTFNI